MQHNRPPVSFLTLQLSVLFGVPFGSTDSPEQHTTGCQMGTASLCTAHKHTSTSSFHQSLIVYSRRQHQELTSGSPTETQTLVHVMFAENSGSKLPNYLQLYVDSFSKFVWKILTMNRCEKTLQITAKLKR